MDMTPQTWPDWYDGRHINEVLFCQQFLDKWCTVEMLFWLSFQPPGAYIAAVWLRHWKALLRNIRIRWYSLLSTLTMSRNWLRPRL